jgi:diphthamide synthase (EF-2-diphthine--ammonia ligase)
VEVAGLLTTVTEAYGRVSMHGVREELLEMQAAAAGLPLRKVYIPAPCSDEEYARIMGAEMEAAVADGVTHVVHGDISLEGVREWREKQLAKAGLEGLFPLWGRDSAELAREMVAGGLSARVSCLDPRVTPRHLAGALYDGPFLDALPGGLDPCGENGEFHTFCWKAPCFEGPVAAEVGVTVEREGFVFTDLVPTRGG